MTAGGGTGSAWRSLKGPTFDFQLLDGLAFSCRPDCGLCCYASPSVSTSERHRLLQIAPELALEPSADSEFQQIPIQGDGGACGLLHQNRCGAHPARPFPCAVFPVSVHVGTRLQASAVLSCPGLSLDHLAAWAGPRVPTNPPEGLDGELNVVAQEYLRRPVATWLKEAARRESRIRRELRSRGGWQEPADVQAALGRADLLPSDDDFPANPPPGPEEGMAALPLFFDPRLGRVALRDHPAGWEVLQLQENGAPPEPIGLFPALEEAPRLDDEGRAVLRGYLGYALRRDFLFWLAYRECESVPDASLSEIVESLLRELAVQVVARANVRARLRGTDGRSLTGEDVLRGVRAVDSDFLDQETLGGLL